MLCSFVINLLSRMQRWYCKHVVCQTCLLYWQCLSCQRRERLYAGECLDHPVSSITSGYSNTITRQRRITISAIARCSCHPHENCMHAKQIIIIYIYIYICYMYLVLFSIVLYRTIVTVCTDNIIQHNYLPQMHQIIHLSPVGCFSPARGKSEYCRVNRNLLTSFPTQIHALLSSLKLCTVFIIFLQLHTLLASGTFRADRPYHMTLRATSEC